MEKFNTDERTGLRYELVGDYYLIAGDDEPEEQHTRFYSIYLQYRSISRLIFSRPTGFIVWRATG